MTLTARIAVIVALVMVLMSAGSGRATAADWERIDAAEAGFDADVAERLDTKFENGDFDRLHSVLVVRHGRLVFESYYDGHDESRGTPLGTVAFTAETLHDMRSISKSVTSLLYGIALADGLVPPLHASILDSFPEYVDLARDEVRRAITVEHMLTMTPGFEWDESIPYSDPANSEIAMERAADLYRFVLERPIVSPPGEQFNYSGGTTAVLAHLIEQGTGMELLAYAREKLFAPLGIEVSVWANSPNGHAAAASGLRLRPRDLARIGQMIIDGGRTGDRQVVPQDWLERSHSKHAQVDGTWSYGYQWWLDNRSPSGGIRVSGFGNGGQWLLVVPSEALVMVVTAGNYNRADQWVMPARVLIDVIIPAMRPL